MWGVEELDPRVTLCICTRAQVVYNVGLCVCLFDITKLEDAYVFPGDGASHTKGGYLLFLGGHISWGSFSVAKGQAAMGLEVTGDVSLGPDSARN